MAAYIHKSTLEEQFQHLALVQQPCVKIFTLPCQHCRRRVAENSSEGSWCHACPSAICDLCLDKDRESDRPWTFISGYGYCFECDLKINALRDVVSKWHPREVRFGHLEAAKTLEVQRLRNHPQPQELPVRKGRQDPIHRNPAIPRALFNSIDKEEDVAYIN